MEELTKIEADFLKKYKVDLSVEFTVQDCDRYKIDNEIVAEMVDDAMFGEEGDEDF